MNRQKCCRYHGLEDMKLRGFMFDREFVRLIERNFSLLEIVRYGDSGERGLGNPE